MHPRRFEAWALSDGRAGNARQAEALAAALAGTGARSLHLGPHAPWRWLAPRRLPGSDAAFGHAFARALRAPPALAIGCGRQAALATRLARAHGARVVQILDPRLDPLHWDVVVVPEHDALRGRNVVTLLGSLHPVDDAWLAAGRAAFPAIGQLPGPLTAVLLGGDSRHGRFDMAMLDALLSRLDALPGDGGSLLLLASRRTPDAIRAALHARAGTAPGLAWTGDADGPNPYAGALGWADRIVCSPDSVNMLSEACATHVPVWVADPGSVGGRPRRFVDALLARGRIAVLGNPPPASVSPLRETARVAAEIRARLGLPPAQVSAA
ncbi:mitochondrial fission ELM1 family protein [Luteimonas sp. BDR2-5]|uniref:mitochondrial fission ELM1 family protein n=1 Tax=Proluteimonas luteida TaxID=2878685 RepID=UPI001E639207|nr:mitochondrial fission ELM1 family protein [Luteimonas sp. BDR2-5]MCD9030057.1 mitochondrial fission ELM1 family protein [Luteimonas sp. BDR2-5]